MNRTVGAFLISAFMLAVCATTSAICATKPAVAFPPNPLPAADRMAMRLDAVQVEWASGPSNSNLSGVPDDEKDDLRQAIETCVQNAFSKSPNGSDAVTFRVVVKLYSGIANGRIMYNGVATSFFADVHVVRSSDQTELAIYKDVYGEFVDTSSFMGVAAARRQQHRLHSALAVQFAKTLHTLFERD